MLCVYSYLVRLIAELYTHYWFPSVDAVLSLPFVRLALMFMHSQCVYVQCVICVYCVHVYPLDVHYYYPLDKEERSYSVFPPISTATNCCTSNNEKERERWDLSIAFPTPSALPVSVTKWTWGPNKQKQWKNKKKGSKQLANLFCFGDCKRLDDFSSLSHRHCLCSSSVHKTVDLCVCVSLFFLSLLCWDVSRLSTSIVRLFFSPSTTSGQPWLIVVDIWRRRASLPVAKRERSLNLFGSGGPIFISTIFFLVRKPRVVTCKSISSFEQMQTSLFYFWGAGPIWPFFCLFPTLTHI